MLRFRTLGVVAVVLGVCGMVAQAAPIATFELVELAEDNLTPGYTTYELVADVVGEAVEGNWDFLVGSVDVALSEGHIYSNPATPGISAPNVWQVAFNAPARYTTFVCVPAWTTFNLAGPANEFEWPQNVVTIAQQDLDLANGTMKAIFSAAPEHIIGHGAFTMARLTVSDGAIGTVTAQMEFAESDGAVYTAPKVNAVDVEVALGDSGVDQWTGDTAQDIIDGAYPNGVGEDDWKTPENDHQGRWNNGQRQITLSLAGPPSGDIVGYSWDFTNRADPLAQELMKDGATVTVTIAELLSAGWENRSWAEGAYVGDVLVTMTQSGGATSEGLLSVYMPEPGSLALLAVGLVGTALRRRRR